MSQPKLDKKLEKLRAGLQKLGSVLVAYSGGVDSTLLLKIARQVLGHKVLAVTALSETYPSSELEGARRLAEELKARHKVIRTRELDSRHFVRNPVNRCYYCKKELFARLELLARKNDLACVADGSNVDDLSDYRPGAKAKEEFGVVSPLQEAGLTKNDVRRLSKRMGLSTWSKPALACLASRIPYRSSISKRRLVRVDRAETILRKKFGIRGNLRVRDYETKARIEVDKKEIKKLSQADAVLALLGPLGYKRVEVDLKGYRTGSMNPARNSN